MGAKVYVPDDEFVSSALPNGPKGATPMVENGH